MLATTMICLIREPTLLSISLDIHLAHVILVITMPADPRMIVVIVVPLVETDMRAPVTTSPLMEDMANPVLVLNLGRPMLIIQGMEI